MKFLIALLTMLSVSACSSGSDSSAPGPDPRFSAKGLEVYSKYQAKGLNLEIADAPVNQLEAFWPVLEAALPNFTAAPESLTRIILSGTSHYDGPSKSVRVNTALSEPVLKEYARLTASRATLEYVLQIRIDAGNEVDLSADDPLLRYRTFVQNLGTSSDDLSRFTGLMNKIVLSDRPEFYEFETGTLFLEARGAGERLRAWVLVLREKVTDLQYLHEKGIELSMWFAPVNAVTEFRFAMLFVESSHRYIEDLLAKGDIKKLTFRQGITTPLFDNHGDHREFTIGTSAAASNAGQNLMAGVWIARNQTDSLGLPPVLYAADDTNERVVNCALRLKQYVEVVRARRANIQRIQFSSVSAYSGGTLFVGHVDSEQNFLAVVGSIP